VIALEGDIKGQTHFREDIMASLFSKIAAYLRSPQGRQMTEKAKIMARDPRKRAQAQQALRKFRKR
jgi:hypothetical protein